MKKIISPLFCAALFFAACNDETTTVSATSDAEKVTAFKELDDCDSTIVGKLVYVKDSVKAFMCTDDGWAAMTGAADGKNGKNGKNGKDGKDGEDGASCTVKAIEGGYKVLCDGDSVGVLLNGAKGDSGAQGESAFALSGYDGSLEEWLKSLKGEDGESCKLEQVSNGFNVTCPGSAPVTISNGTNCDIESDVDGLVTIKCGTGDSAKTAILYKAVCGAIPYNPESGLFCSPGNQLYMTDSRDGHNYKVVKIGAQTWMGENLNYATEVTGTDSSSFCYGDGDEDVTDRGAANCVTYGRLYTWAAAVGQSEDDCGFEKNCTALGDGDVQGVCPKGWHLPSVKEFRTLIAFAGGKVEAFKALVYSSGWDGVDGTDDYSFAALPTGYYYHSKGEFAGKGGIAHFWTSLQFKDSRAFGMLLSRSADAIIGDYDKYDGNSVRCIKNPE